MDNLLNLFKSVIVSIGTIVSVFNPFNSIPPKTTSLPLSIPTLTPQVFISPTTEKTTKAQPTFIKQEQKYSLPTSTPLPVNDPDPLITCQSKTGNILVRRSVCSSNTDCPDGNGGYVFESQGSCKERWNKLSRELKQSAQDFSNAILEQQRLRNERSKFEYSQKSNEIIDNSKTQIDQITQQMQDDAKKFNDDLQKRQQEEQESLKNFIVTPIPTPTPQQGGGRLLDPYGTSY